MVCCVLQAIPIEINIINKQNNFHFVVFMKPRKPFIYYIYIYLLLAPDPAAPCMLSLATSESLAESVIQYMR